MVVSAVFDRKNRCWGPLRVGSTCNVGKKLATYAHVADMSPTCRRHIWLSSKKLVCFLRIPIFVFLHGSEKSYSALYVETFVSGFSLRAVL